MTEGCPLHGFWGTVKKTNFKTLKPVNLNSQWSHKKQANQAKTVSNMRLVCIQLQTVHFIFLTSCNDSGKKNGTSDLTQTREWSLLCCINFISLKSVEGIQAVEPFECKASRPYDAVIPGFAYR